MYENPIKEYHFSGSLSKFCDGFVAEKRALGYSYNREARQLSEFSRFTESFSFPENVLTQEVVESWISRRPNDSDRNYYARYALIKLFAEYMIRAGYSAYCPDRTDIAKIQWAYTPHIFTHDEISRFFVAVDALKKKTHSMSPRRHLMMPIIFRLLYCCGLRVSEVLGLTKNDVDLENGILIIRQSKFDKTRYIPMSDELTKTLISYSTNTLRDEDMFLFPSPRGGHYDTRVIYSVFRDIIWDIGISHQGRGKGPRVHDFRHTFAVHCLEKWSHKGTPLSSALPRLSTYLGHNNLAATERYLRMTAEVYPEISELLSEKYGYIVPKVGDAI